MYYRCKQSNVLILIYKSRQLALAGLMTCKLYWLSNICWILYIVLCIFKYNRNLRFLFYSKLSTFQLVIERQHSSVQLHIYSCSILLREQGHAEESVNCTWQGQLASCKCSFMFQTKVMQSFKYAAMWHHIMTSWKTEGWKVLQFQLKTTES